MLRRVLFTCAAAGMLAAPGLEGQEPPPWFGTWQLAAPESISRFVARPYKKVITRIEPWRDGVKVTYDMVRTRGGITHIEWVGKFDGMDYPVQGVDTFLTNAYRQIDERSYEILVKVDRQLVATATAVVAPDGGTLTVTTEERDARGQPATSVAVYRKQ